MASTSIPSTSSRTRQGESISTEGLSPFRPLRAPHIPDEPTEASVKKLLFCMERQVLYFETGEAERVTEKDTPIACGIEISRHKFIPVIGIGWFCDHNTAIVYIDDKPYTFAYDWIGGHSKWLDQQHSLERRAGLRRS